MTLYNHNKHNKYAICRRVLGGRLSWQSTRPRGGCNGLGQLDPLPLANEREEVLPLTWVASSSFAHAYVGVQPLFYGSL